MPSSGWLNSTVSFFLFLYLNFPSILGVDFAEGVETGARVIVCNAGVVAVCDGWLTGAKLRVKAGAWLRVPKLGASTGVVGATVAEDPPSTDKSLVIVGFKVKNSFICSTVPAILG